MQITPLSELSSRRQDASRVLPATPSGRLGTIPVDRRMTMLERQRSLSQQDSRTRPSMFAPCPASGDARRHAVPERFDFVRLEPAIA